MRYVIYLLVAMNCAYFTWQFFLAVPAEPTERFLSHPSFDVRPLVTIEENDARQSRSETREIKHLTETQPPGALLPLSCQALGPFLAESDLKDFKSRLDRLGLAARTQTRYQREQVGYTVLLSSEGYEEALQNKRRLEKENIMASFIGTNNVLSLGAFRDKSRAEKILASAQALGFDARLEPGYAKRSTYWLVFQGHNNQNGSLKGLIRKHPDLHVDNVVCP